MPYNDIHGKFDLINKLREIYHNNNKQLILIKEFEENYRSEDAIKCTINKKSVLFEIECDLAMSNSIILAPINHFSAHPDEQEILIDIGAVFKILFIIYAYTNVSLLWEDLLRQMGQYDKVLEYFTKLLKIFNETENNYLEIHLYLGDIYLEKGDYDEVYKYHFYVYEALIKMDSPRFSYRSVNGLCTVLRFRCLYDKVIEYLICYMKYLDKINSRKCCAYATCLTNMENCYYGLSKYDDALNSYEKAQNLLKSYYSTDHFEIGRSLDNIDNVYRA
ncbi:unnamed protein product [Rotaria sp. Silwood1]|nr:unnamed protein product [Rotaria sp. Silwood1]